MVIVLLFITILNSNGNGNGRSNGNGIILDHYQAILQSRGRACQGRSLHRQALLASLVINDQSQDDEKKFRKINNLMFVSPLDSGMPSFDLKQHNNNMMLWVIVKSLLEILRRRVSSKWSYCEAFVVKLGENRGAANRKRH